MCDSSRPVLLRVAEVARILRMSRSAAYLLVRRGELPAVRVSRRAVRVPATDLERFIAERRGARWDAVEPLRGEER